MRKKINKTVGVLAMSSLLLVGGGNSVGAKEIGRFSGFNVTFSGVEKTTNDQEKHVTGRDAVVNLDNDTGSAWILVNMRKNTGELRGSTEVQRGKKEYIRLGNDSKKGQRFYLGMKKKHNTGGGNVTIKGRWSPDYK